MTHTPKAFDYRAKSAELEGLLLKLQDSDIQVDEATRCYEAGLKLIDELETYLNQAENIVKKLHSKSN